MFNDKIKKSLYFTFVIILLLSLTGCWDINEIDQTQFPSYITVDFNEKKAKENEGSFLYSIQYPIFNPDAPKKINNISTTTNSLQGAIDKFQGKTMGYISLGMLRTMILSKNISQKGILPHIDAIWRNPMIPGSAILIISEEKAEKIQEIKLAATENIGAYIEGLSETAAKNGIFPEVTLNQFYIVLRTKGIEPYIPLVRYGGTDIEIIGAAVFQDDKMVGQINMPELRALMFLRNESIKGGYSIKVNDFVVDYFIQKIDYSINPIYRDGRWTIDINIKNLVADVKEHTSKIRIIDNKKELLNIERHLAAEIKKEIKTLFSQLQKYESDVIGIGEIARVEYPEIFDAKNWTKDFSTAKIQIKVKVTVRRFGIAT